ncbi:MAG: hypothetical protein J5779_02265 [Clostridia bacterium]|nr:hypothetical protein [Clostridia bacterium]
MREAVKTKIKKLIIVTIALAIVISIGDAVKKTIENHTHKENTVVVSTTEEQAEN